MERRLFGTDGIRGTANMYPMTSEVALKLGRAVSYVFKERHGRGRIVVGKDTRLSGYMLETAIASGICSMGVDVWLVGPLPTPGIAFITSSMRADAGIVISASHNPYQDNGIKIFSGDGFKLPDDLEYEIEKMVMEGSLDTLRPVANEVGKAHRIDDAVGRYIVFLKNIFPQQYSLDGLRVVVDCAQGAAYKVAPSVFEELGAHVISFGVEPDGENINRECGSLYPDSLRRHVMEHNAHIGIALDGDADRVAFVDEKGKIIDGDGAMVVLARHLKEKGRLKKNTVVATIASNMGVETCLKTENITVVRTNVGDRYVLETILKDDYNFGGEKSGHVVFLDHNTTGDGMVTALKILNVMIEKQKGLCDLMEGFTELPQVELNVKVREKKPVDDCPRLMKAIEAVRDRLGEEGRVVVRYSGTEMKLRVMVEGMDDALVAAYAEEIAESARQEIGGN
ncbi:MAG: phosphoglucosamine mutase [Syntrophobacterales bacterium]|jgi:phosphoglucosamine mutase|nr:phosphoglucosamine mutase [Syntrophobacterales bacterium]